MARLWICRSSMVGLRGAAVTMLESDLGQGHRDRRAAPSVGRDKNVISLKLVHLASLTIATAKGAPCGAKDIVA